LKRRVLPGGKKRRCGWGITWWAQFDHVRGKKLVERERGGGATYRERNLGEESRAAAAPHLREKKRGKAGKKKSSCDRGAKRKEGSNYEGGLRNFRKSAGKGG